MVETGTETEVGALALFPKIKRDRSAIGSDVSDAASAFRVQTDPRVEFLQGRCRSRLCVSLPQLYRLIETGGMSPQQALLALKLSSHLSAFYLFKNRCQKLDVWVSRGEFEARDGSGKAKRFFRIGDLSDGYQGLDHVDGDVGLDPETDLVLYRVGRLESFLENGALPILTKDELGMDQFRSSFSRLRRERVGKGKARWAGRLLARPKLRQGLLFLWDSGLRACWIYWLLSLILPDVSWRRVYELLLCLRKARGDLGEAELSSVQKARPIIPVGVGTARAIRVSDNVGGLKAERVLHKPVVEVDASLNLSGNHGAGSACNGDLALLLQLFGPLPEPGTRIGEFLNSDCARKLRSGWLWRKAAGVVGEEASFNWELDRDFNAEFAGLPLLVKTKPDRLISAVEELGKCLSAAICLRTGAQEFLGALYERERHYSPWLELMVHLILSAYRSGCLQELKNWADRCRMRLEAPAGPALATWGVGGKPQVLQVDFWSPERILFDREPDFRSASAWFLFQTAAVEWRSLLSEYALHPFTWADNGPEAGARVFSRFSRFYFSGVCAGLREGVEEEGSDSVKKLLGELFIRR